MARSEYWSCPLRLPTPAAAHVAIASGVSQKGDVASPHEGSVVLGPVPDAIRCLVLRMHSRLHIEIMTRRRSRWSTCRPLLAHRAESAHQRRQRTLRLPVRFDQSVTRREPVEIVTVLLSYSQVSYPNEGYRSIRAGVP